MEELIEIIVKKNIGCKIGDLFAGILIYADHIVLLAPRRHALQLMVDTFSSYAKEYHLIFSANVDPSKRN